MGAILDAELNSAPERAAYLFLVLRHQESQQVGGASFWQEAVMADKLYQDREWLEDHYTRQQLGASQIAKLADCGKTAIKYWLKKHGIERRSLSEAQRARQTTEPYPPSHKIMFDKETENQIIHWYTVNEISFRKIANRLNVNHSVIRRILVERNVEIRPPTKEWYSFNEHAFDRLDHENPVYWLGYIYADGCVARNALRLDVKRTDADHLAKLKNFLESDNPIHYYESKGFGAISQKALLVISSRHLAFRLRELGIVKNRTKLKNTIAAISPPLIRHFIRGVFDGDGSPRKRYPSFRFCSKWDLLTWLRDTFAVEVGSNPDLEPAPSKSPKVFYIEFSGKYQGKRLADFLYKEATVWMDRKKEIVDSWDLPDENFYVQLRNEKGQFVN